MLVSKSKIDDGDVVSFKLVNGDEIVAKVASQSDDSYVLSKPCLIVPSGQGIGMMQALFSADPDKDVEIKKQHVMMHAPTIDKLQSHYIQTTTGIQPVTKGSIIT